jgi:hypothetical protein
MPGGLSGVPSYTIIDAGRVRPLCERPPKKDKKRSVNSCALICVFPKRWTKEQREDLEKKTPGITVLRRLELGAFLVQKIDGPLPLAHQGKCAGPIVEPIWVVGLQRQHSIGPSVAHNKLSFTPENGSLPLALVRQRRAISESRKCGL